jgi:predicted heme/steroid binding protein
VNSLRLHDNGEEWDWHGEGVRVRLLHAGGLAILFFLGLLVLVLAARVGNAAATPQYSAQTGRDCAYCHVSPGGALTAEGAAFKENGFRVQAASPGRSGAAVPGPIIPYPGWLWEALLWVHVAAIVAWLAGVHINTPRTDRLAWPALIVLGATGILLTLGKVGSADALSSTRWGALLLTKTALFVVLLAIATIATFVIEPRLAAQGKSEPRRSRSQGHFKAQGRVTVVYRGKVYDVTGSRLWPEGKHARRHDAWQDLTGALAGAPHGPEVLERFTLVEDAGEDRSVALMSIYTVMRYASFALMLAALLVVVFW